jgi:antitoxin MazE
MENITPDPAEPIGNVTMVEDFLPPPEQLAMNTQKVIKWGESLGVRLPQKIMEQLGWEEGEKVMLSTDGNRLILAPNKPKYSLNELLKEAKPEQQHDEIDWGEIIGEENW